MAQFLVVRHHVAMKMFIITLLLLLILSSGCSTTSEHQARLERIAREYASRQKIDFDFTKTRVEIYPDDVQRGVVDVCFFHGDHQPCFEARIDNADKVIGSSVSTFVEAQGVP